MTTLTDTQVITASGGLVELGYSQITSSVTVGTSVTNVTSTLTVVCDGGPILVEFFAPSARCFAGGDNLTFSLFEDGVQKASPWGESVSSNDLQATPVQLQYRLTPSAGSHTYQVKAISSLSSSQQVRAGSGGTGSPAYSPAFLRVSKIVQATQWPAVTTGTIICTSSTRPASPFEGQAIYETDTDIEYRWTGSIWLPISPSPSVRIKAGASQTGIASGSWTKLTFPTSTVVNPYGFTVSSGTVTIPSGYGGIYAVQCQIQWDSNTVGDRILAFAGAGASYDNLGISGQTSPGTVTAYYRSTLSGLMQLNAGSSYSVWALQGSGGNRSTEISFMENWLHLVKVT